MLEVNHPLRLRSAENPHFMRYFRSALYPVLSGLVIASLFAASSPALAQGALLRITCDGNDAAAEVFVNGAFKGTCPLDVHVPAGSVKLRVAKKANENSERIFEQEMRLGDGAIKRIEAILSGPRLTADGQKREYDRLALERAKEAKREQDRQADIASGALPARPQLPFAVSEDTWRTIEGSDAYRDLPPPKRIKTRYLATVQSQNTGTKNATWPSSPPASMETTLESTPIGGRCSIRKSRSKGAWAGDGFGYEAYHCGPIPLGDQKSSVTIIEISGSIFPIRIGAREVIRTVHSFSGPNPMKVTVASTSEVLSKGPATALDPRLTGTAWKIRYSTLTEASGVDTQTMHADDDYLEDLGLRLSAIGILDSERKSFFIPTPGSRSVMSSQGDYGSRTTTVYSIYEWSIE